MDPNKEERIYTPPQNDASAGQPKSSRKTIIFIAGGLVLIALFSVAATLFVRKNDSSELAKNNAVIVLPAAEVGITAAGFNPATIKIKKGQIVSWTNLDDKPHQVASDPFPTSETLPGLRAEAPSEKGESYSFTFEESGTYTYHDRLNPLKHKGTVVVE